MHSPFYEEIFELIPSTKVSIEEALSYLLNIESLFKKTKLLRINI